MKKASLAILTGAAGGLLGGLMGVGGGIIMVPMMVAFLKLSQHRAHGTSLAVIVPIALAGVIPYALSANAHWAVIAPLVAGTSVGVAIGAKWMMKISAKRLRQVFGVLLIIVAVRMLFVSIPSHPPEGGLLGDGWGVLTLVGLGLGLFAGGIAGLMGVGGGIIIVPGLVLVLGFDQHTAQGISLATIAATGIVGTVVNSRQNNVDSRAAMAIIPSAVVFSLLGGYLANQIGGRALMIAFSCLPLLMSVKLLTQDLGKKAAKEKVEARG